MFRSRQESFSNSGKFQERLDFRLGAVAGVDVNVKVEGVWMLAARSLARAVLAQNDWEKKTVGIFLLMCASRVVLAGVLFSMQRVQP